MLPIVEPMEPCKLPRIQNLVVANAESYLFEHKIDGWRCLAYVDAGTVRLISKQGKRFQKFSLIEKALRYLGFNRAIFDGELAYFDARGNPNFYGVQKRNSKVVYVVFDVLWLGEFDLRGLTLEKRKTWLARIFQGSTGHVRGLSYSTAADGIELLDMVKVCGWEGVVAKRLGSSYDARLLDAWVKIYNPDYVSELIKRKQIFNRER